MLIKFLDHGRGSGRGAARYLLAKHDHLGIERAEVQVLRGNPELVGQVADSLDFQHRYTSGVIAWAPEDAPSDEQIAAVIDDFERLAFAGLGSERIAYSAILHREDNGGVHIHVFNARVDLATGKSLNIAPPGWQRAFDLLRDHYNHLHGWAQPDDPARARTHQPGGKALIDAARLRAGLQVEPDAKALVTEYLMQRVQSGAIKDRSDVLEALKYAGFEINRQGKDYISIKDADTGQKIRLKGAIYDQDFTAGRALESADRAGSKAYRKPDERRAAAARGELEAAIQRRVEYNKKRYQKPPQDDRARPGEDAARDARAEQAASKALGNADAFSASGNSRRLPADDRSNMALPARSAFQRPDRDLDLSRRAESNGHHQPRLDDMRRRRRAAIPLQIGALGGQNGRRYALAAGSLATIAAVPKLSNVHRFYDTRGSREGFLQRDAPLELRQRGGSEQRTDKLLIASAAGGLDDRIREAVAAAVERVREGLRRAREAYDEAARRFDEALRYHDSYFAGIPGALRKYDAAARRFNEGVAVMIDNRAAELERFKTEINLVEYVEAQGYEIDRRESSRSSAVMRSGDDKIIVATGTDGHGIYFSVKDPSDRGTIIDFVQRRLGLNLGQIRKELRPWIGELSAPPRRKPLNQRPQKPVPSTSDRQAVQAAWQRMNPGPAAYLTRERGLSETILSDQRFASTMRSDARGNAVFAHFDNEGISGFELKNKGFTGFASGGQKGLWKSANVDSASALIVTESAIDAISHAQLTSDKSAAYISVGGTMSDKQRELVGSTFSEAAARGAQIIIATDADAAGDRLAKELAELAPSAKRARPQQGKDWNEQLQLVAREREHGLFRY